MSSLSTMHAAVSSVNCGLFFKPISVKNFMDRGRSFTGRLTKILVAIEVSLESQFLCGRARLGPSLLSCSRWPRLAGRLALPSCHRTHVSREPVKGLRNAFRHSSFQGLIARRTRREEHRLPDGGAPAGGLRQVQRVDRLGPLEAPRFGAHEAPGRRNLA